MIDTLRLFLDMVDFSDAEMTGWDIFPRLVDGYGATNCKLDMPVLFEWLFRQFREDLKLNYQEDDFMSTFHWFAYVMPSALPSWLSLGPSEVINTVDDEGSTALAKQLTGYIERDSVVTLTEMLKYGADPNSKCVWPKASPKMESPTSLSLYSNYGFGTWMAALYKAGIDANKVFDKDFKHQTLSEAGWTRQNFQKLTGWKCGYDAHPGRIRCKTCPWWIDYIRVQPVWAYALEEIKHGKDPNDTIWATSTYAKEPSEPESDFADPFDVSQKSKEGRDDNFEKQDQAENAKGITFAWDTDIFLALHQSFCGTGNCMLMFPNGISRPEVEMDDGSSAEAVQFDLESWRSLKNEDLICMDCWLDLLGVDPKKTAFKPYVEVLRSLGVKLPDANTDADTDASTDADTDPSSDHEFSRFLLDP